LTKQLGATAKLQSKKLLPEQREVHQRKLLRWVSFVLDKYAEDTRAFRGGGAAAAERGGGHGRIH